MKNLLLLFIMVLSLAPSFAQSPSNVLCSDCDTKEITISLSEKWDVPHSLYNAICMENDIVPGKIGMGEFRRLAKLYAVRVGLVYTNYTFNGTQNLEILHAKVIKNESITSNSTTTPRDSSNLHNDVSDAVTSVSTPRVVYSDTIVRYIESERIITKTVLDTFMLAIIVPVDTSSVFCDCSNKTYEELNMYYTETLRNRRKAKDPELRDRYGFCAYQIRRYKAQMRKKVLPSGKDYTFNGIMPNMDIGGSYKSSSAPRKKRRTRKLGRGYSKGRGGLWAKLFPFLNC